MQEGELAENTSFPSTGEGLFKRFTKISFYSNGAVRRGELNAPGSVRVGAQTVRMDSGFPLEFYENGNLASGRLASTAKLQNPGGDVALKGLTAVRFHSNGRLAAGTLEEGAVFAMGERTVEVNPGSSVTFYENGRLNEGYARLPWRMSVRGAEVVLDPRALIGF